MTPPDFRQFDMVSNFASTLQDSLHLSLPRTASGEKRGLSLAAVAPMCSELFLPSDVIGGCNPNLLLAAAMRTLASVAQKMTRPVPGPAQSPFLQQTGPPWRPG